MTVGWPVICAKIRRTFLGSNSIRGLIRFWQNSRTPRTPRTPYSVRSRTVVSGGKLKNAEELHLSAIEPGQPGGRSSEATENR